VASPIIDTWVYSTILIENDWGERGTGFIVSRNVSQNKCKLFLITNKHVLNKDQKMRNQATEIKLHLNYRISERNIIGKVGILPIVLDNGMKIWREHPERDIDVLAIDITSFMVQFPNVVFKHAPIEALITSEELAEWDITIGEEIFIIGYPVGIKQGNTNMPIVRSGIIASIIGDKLVDTVIENKNKRSRTIRGFLIDGGIVPGSSGSPVILKPVSGRLVKGNISLGLPPQYLLGIISETRYAPVITDKWETESFAGIGMAFDAATIRETIELFF
jgi:hypothetical protein